MIKLGIMGKANTGKNTLSKMLAKQIREYFDNKYLTVSYLAFADPMKEIIQSMFPSLPRKFLYGSSKFRNEIIPDAFKEGIPLTVRQLLIDIGTAGRKYNPEIWINNFDRRFNCGYNNIVICTDVRFVNEFNYLRDKDFYLIKLYRNTDQPKIQHESETGQDMIKDEEFNFVIHNDKTKTDLREMIKQIMPHLKN